MEKEAVIKELMTIPWIGKVSANEFYGIGIRKVSDLKDKDPEDIYLKLCIKAGGPPLHRCYLYVIRCAVYYASNEVHNPAMLKWNFWSDANLLNNGITKQRNNKKT